MKIVLVQHKSFLNGSGGAEKMCCFLANGFRRSGNEVVIATNEGVQGQPMFDLEAGITVTNVYDAALEQVQLKALLNYKGNNPLRWLAGKINKKLAKFYNAGLAKKYGGNVVLFNLKQRSSAWKAYLESLDPDIVLTVSLDSALEISYQQHYNFPIVNTVNGRPDYDYMPVFGPRDSLEMNLLIDTFKQLSAIQVLFESYKTFVPPSLKGEIFVIPNPVPQLPATDFVQHQLQKERYEVIHIGRLDDGCKQQSMAIAIFSELALTYPEWDLVFWGIGSDQELLQAMIEEKGLSSRIFLKGFTADPLSHLRESDIFIFPSKYEGFPLALTEAMTVGLPVLGLRSCSGVNELIDHGRNGYLAADSADMKDYLSQLMNSAALRSRMGLAAKEDMQQYDPELVRLKWNQLLEETKLKHQKFFTM